MCTGKDVGDFRLILVLCKPQYVPIRTLRWIIDVNYSAKSIGTSSRGQARSLPLPSSTLLPLGADQTELL